MFQNLYPSEDYDSAYQIDYEGFYDKGYRGILFDVDNTLVEHDQPVTLPAIELFENLNVDRQRSDKLNRFRIC